MLRVEPEIVANYVATGKVRLVFWHVLDHRPSLLASQAAECAGAQAPIKFWEMHTLLYDRQPALWSADKDTLTTFASELGLDTTTFRSCLDSETVVEKLQRLDQQRRSEGIRLRPSFNINGRVYPGAQPYSNFVQVFEEILSQ